MPVVIRKLELGQPAVQQKVLAILSHVNKVRVVAETAVWVCVTRACTVLSAHSPPHPFLWQRLKPLPAVQLPLRELAELYGDASSAPLSRNFALVYVEKACARAKAVDVAAEVRVVLAGLVMELAWYDGRHL